MKYIEFDKEELEKYLKTQSPINGVGIPLNP